MASSFQGAHCPQEGRLMGVRWDGASPLSTRHVEALREERGVDVDPSPINRGTLQESPRLDETFPRRQRPGWVRGRLDETYSTGKGQGRGARALGTKTARPWTLCAPPIETQRPPDGCSRRLAAGMASPRRARWTAVTPRQPPSRATTRRREPRSRSARALSHPHRGTRPSSSQPAHPSPGRGPILGRRSGNARRHRPHAHDQATAEGRGRGRQRGAHGGRTVLLPGCFIPLRTQGYVPLQHLLSKMCDKTRTCARSTGSWAPSSCAGIQTWTLRWKRSQ
jgi:hypothetical protein